MNTTDRYRVLDGLLRKANALSRAAIWVAGGLTLASALYITGDVLVRYFLGRPLGGADELSGYAFAISISWALSFATLQRANIRIDALYQYLPPRIAALADWLALVVLSVFIVYWTRYAATVAGLSWDNQSTANTTIALGVPRPSAVPLYYRIAANQISQDGELQAVGPHSSGEAEVFVFTHEGRLLVSLASDHTDRKLESTSVALSKQLCVKPVARAAWLFDEVAPHWDSLILRSWIEEDGQRVLYQEGALASLRPPAELIEGCFGADGMPAGAGMTCGTMAAIGGIRPSTSFEMELFDPVLGRSIRHAYRVEVLPEVA